MRVPSSAICPDRAGRHAAIFVGFSAAGDRRHVAARPPSRRAPSRVRHRATPASTSGTRGSSRTRCSRAGSPSTRRRSSPARRTPRPANLSLHNYTTSANVLAWPLIPLVGLVAAFNLVFLFNIALSGYAGYLLARDLTGRDAEVADRRARCSRSRRCWSPAASAISASSPPAPLPIFALLLRRLRRDRPAALRVRRSAPSSPGRRSRDAYYGVFCLLMAGITLLVQFVSVERAVDVPVVRIAGLRRTLDVLLRRDRQLRLRHRAARRRHRRASSASASARTRCTRRCCVLTRAGCWRASPLRPAASLVAAHATREPLPRGPRGRRRRGRDAAAALAGAVRARRSRDQRQRQTGRRRYWRSSPPGVDLLGAVHAQPEPRAVGRRRCEAR